MSGNDDLHSIRLGYLDRILSERWPATTKSPAVLAISRDTGWMTAKFMARGCRAEGVRLQDTSLESLQERLGGRTAAFDVVTCCDVFEHVEDWPAIVGVIARVLRGGGVLFYSVTSRAAQAGSLVSRLARRWRWDEDRLITPGELSAALRREGLLPQRVVGLGRGLDRPAMSRTVKNGAVSYMGYAFKRRERRPEQWVFVPPGGRQQETSSPVRKAG